MANSYLVCLVNKDVKYLYYICHFFSYTDSDCDVLWNLFSWLKLTAKIFFVSIAFKAVGIVGAVIMPHNMYLHSALVKVCILMDYDF